MCGLATLRPKSNDFKGYAYGLFLTRFAGWDGNRTSLGVTPDPRGSPRSGLRFPASLVGMGIKLSWGIPPRPPILASLGPSYAILAFASLRVVSQKS